MSELSPSGGSEGYEARDDEADAQRRGQRPVEEGTGGAGGLSPRRGYQREAPRSGSAAPGSFVSPGAVDHKG